MMTWNEFKNKTRRRYILRLLINNNCMVAKAAAEAGMNRTDLYKQIKRYKVDLKALAAAILEKGKNEVIGENVRPEGLERKLAREEIVRRSLKRKLVKPDWNRPIPGYTPYQPKQRNTNVRT